MVMLVALSQSSCSLSSDERKLNNRTCNIVDGMSSNSVPLLNSNTFADLFPSSDNVAYINHRQPPIKQKQRMNDSMLEMDTVCSDNSFSHCDGSPSFSRSSVLPLMNQTVRLNERRRAILDLSISKIQTISTSNVAVSMRKSLLIYNVMKSLQQDFDACDSLIEIESEIINNDVEMPEMNEFDEENWQKLISDLNCSISSNNDPCNHRLGYEWPWGTLVNTTSKDTTQGLEKDCDNLFTVTSGNCSFNAGNIWNNPDSTDSYDDYLGMLFAWEDENYNPLTNCCDLTHAEITNMFHLSSYHLNNQLVSQA